MKKLLVLLMLVFSFSAFADDWIFLIENSDQSGAYYGLAGSYLISTNKKGEKIVVWTEKYDNKKTKQITVGKLYVRTSDCLKKQGQGVVVNLNGDFQYDFDFIFGAGSVGAYRAENLCQIYLDKFQKSIDKSM